MIEEEGGTQATGRPYVGPEANGKEQPPPVHEEPAQVAQPFQELVERVDRAWEDIGALISRTDQLEATVRRVDRQVIMTVGTLALILWVTRKALLRVEEIAGDGV
jgi:hypothetical protein